MSTFSLFEQIDLKTSEELLSKLIPNEEELLWNRKQQDHYYLPWIFRGQMNADWDLNPSAMRTGNLHSFNPGQVEPYDMSIQQQLCFEEELVISFATGVDLQGLEVPGDMPEIRDLDWTRKKSGPLDFPPVFHRPMYALAQHYGIPTRFLDWSRNSLVAAYFACVDIARQMNHPSKHKKLQSVDKLPERFAIWALSEKFVNMVAHLWNPGVKLITVPTCSNPNLHAQKGLFTLVYYRESFPDYKDEKLPPERHLPSVNSLIQNVKDIPYIEIDNGDEEVRIEYDEPVLYKFTVPSTNARTLLRLLSLHGITAASVYPGHKGVADAIFEENWYSIAEPGHRN